MGGFVANYTVMGTAEVRQREGVGRRTIKDEKNLAVGLENLANARNDATGPFIVAVRNLGTRVRFRERSPSRWTNRRGIIAGEVEALGCSHRRFP
jgi:hypothetical protein